MDTLPPKVSTPFPVDLKVNGFRVAMVVIGNHYKIKHGHYLNEMLILDLVHALDGGTFPKDSVTSGIDYYAADVKQDASGKIFRLIWLHEGTCMEVLGVINVYRRKRAKKRGKS